MTDIITRLRERAARKWRDEGNRSASLFGEAADEIERLRHELHAITATPSPAAWIDGSGHPRHLSYLQGAHERKLYGPLRPLYDQAALEAAVTAERERCAQLCDDRSAEYWRDYKDKSSAWRGDGRTEAMSDEAEACAKAIRGLATVPADTETASRSATAPS